MIYVGTCGYQDFRPEADWKSRYASKLAAYSHHYDACELNRTFYELPRQTTAGRWRSEVRDAFVFTMKAWMGITHPVKGSLWRKRKEELTDQQRNELGNLRPTASVFEAWRATLEIAETLEARVVLLQTPAAFSCSADNAENMRRTLSEIERGSVAVAWEPRGDWNENPDEVARLCNELGLVHAVDPLRRDPVHSPAARASETRIRYLRMHGLNARETDYNYTYSAAELRDLAERARELSEEVDETYCMFNNLGMHENAPELKRLLETG